MIIRNLLSEYKYHKSGGFCCGVENCWRIAVEILAILGFRLPILDFEPKLCQTSCDSMDGASSMNNDYSRDPGSDEISVCSQRWSSSRSGGTGG
ncbi:hypothetical protein O77CONTIG1_00226 [Leptolyngbya sp. O-77]|nr:hypothetical protein O77CONTIG1_00226 [Leptolyngbya sp. O-77]